MARITVEDCKNIVKDRFELVALAAKRGKDICAGAPIFIARDNDKNAVVALREIAAKKVLVDTLRNSLKLSMSKYYRPNSEIEEDAELSQEVREEISSYTDEVVKKEENPNLIFSEDELNVED